VRQARIQPLSPLASNNCVMQTTLDVVRDVSLSCLRRQKNFASAW